MSLGQWYALEQRPECMMQVVKCCLLGRDANRIDGRRIVCAELIGQYEMGARGGRADGRRQSHAHAHVVPSAAGRDWSRLTLLPGHE